MRFWVLALVLAGCGDAATSGGWPDGGGGGVPDGATTTDGGEGDVAPGDGFGAKDGGAETAGADGGGATDAGAATDGGADGHGGGTDAALADTTGLDGATDGSAADGEADTDDAATPTDGGPDGTLDTGNPTDAPDTSTTPPPLFDLAAIADPSTADCTFEGSKTVLKDGVLVTVWRASYLSWESIDGTLVPIRIRGYAARPNSAALPLPGVVQAHGLGGYAEESHATGTAALLGMAVMAYTGPGGGTIPENTSEGLPAGHQDGYRMFDTIPDPRGSWFWGHAVAAMRGLTCLAATPDVDGTRLGITGFSAGGVVSLMVAGVDPRVTASVPLSGTGAWSVAMQSPKAWQHTLLTKAGLTMQSPEWLAHQALLDPSVLVAGTGAHVMMVNGSTDEFFPLSAHVATYDAIGASDKRTSIAANFDHGCYALTGVEGEKTIAERAELHAKGAQRMWLRHWLTDDPDWKTVPPEPTVSLQDAGGATLVVAEVGPPGSALQIEEVTLWWSNDDAFLFGGVKLDPYGGNTWGLLALFPLAPGTVSFVDVQYRTKGLFPQRFTLSSRPAIPPGHVPHIRDIATCL